MSITEQQITSLAEALRGELELGSDGSTFESTIRLWLDGDYDGPGSLGLDSSAAQAAVQS